METILERHGMADCKQAKAPVAANQQFPTLTEAEVDITVYWISDVPDDMYAS